jgi:hypothetical protein
LAAEFALQQNPSLGILKRNQTHSFACDFVKRLTDVVCLLLKRPENTWPFRGWRINSGATHSSNQSPRSSCCNMEQLRRALTLHIAPLQTIGEFPEQT